MGLFGKSTKQKAEEILIKAAEEGDLATLKRLVAEGVNVNAAGGDGWTALMWAAREGKLDCLEHLTAKGANLEATEMNGETALMKAADYGKLGCLEHLVAKGANLEATDNNGETALMKPVRVGELGCLEHLIAKGAKLNAQSNYKHRAPRLAYRTALHFAAHSSHAPCVESLLKAGADASIKDRDGNTALDVANSNRVNAEVVKVLEDPAAYFAAQAAQKAKEAAAAAAAKAAAEKAAAERAAAAKAAAQAAVEKAAAEKAAAERAAAAKAAALGLLQPLEALSLDADTLRAATAAAVAYCDAQGASSVADLVESNLLDDLMASFTLKPVQANKLLQSLKGPAAAAPEQAAAGKKEAAARAARAAAETAAVSVETHTIKEETYDVVEQLNPGGNASIWRVKDARGDKYVLKVSDEASIKIEVEARKAVGWNRHPDFLLKVIGYEGPKMILESAEVTLRQRLNAGTMEAPQAGVCVSHVLKGLEELHKCKVVHLDLKPENIFRVKDERTGDPVWKLGDLDSHRKQGEPVSDITEHYAAPEIATAMLKGANVLADAKMDIFSLGLVAYEVLAGVAFLPASAFDKDAALHALGGSGLDALLQKQLAPLPQQFKGLLQHMLKVSPGERKRAQELRQDGALTGQVTTAIRGLANREVLQGQQEVKKAVLSALEQAEQRLAEQVQQGNEQVIKQMRQMQQQALPQLLSAVKQHALELRSCQNEGLSPAELAEVQAAALASLKQAVDEQAKQGSDESLRKMVEELQGGGPTAGQDADAVLGKLDALAARMESMQAQFSELGGKMDEQVKEQVAGMATLRNKLDQLLLGDHEQVFHCFLLVPKPAPKGRMGKALRKLSPKNWLNKPMLLVPYYADMDGALQPAPLLGTAKEKGGFEVPKPKDFVKAHPRAVMLAMWAVKFSIKVTASQLCVTLPTESLDALMGVTDGLLLAVLGEGARCVQELDLEEERDLAGELDEKIDTLFNAPDDAIDKVAGNEKFVEMSKQDYTSLKAWMDKTHRSWVTECGLVQQLDQSSGKLEWRPLGA